MKNTRPRERRSPSFLPSKLFRLYLGGKLILPDGGRKGARVFLLEGARSWNEGKQFCFTLGHEISGH